MTTEEPKLSKGSYCIANQLAKQSKPYSDGAFVKQAFKTMFDCFKLEQNVFANMDASPSAMSRAVKDMSGFLEGNLKKTAADFVFFSLAISKSTVYFAAHFAVYIRGVDADFNVTEELASLVPLSNLNELRDMHEAVKSTLERFSLNLAKLSGVTTEDRKNKKLLKLIQNDAIAAGNSELMKHEKNQAFDLFETEIGNVPNVLRTECVGLRSNVQLGKEHCRMPTLDFYKNHLSKETYPLFHNHALFTLSLFPSAYDCKKMFSKTKRMVNKNRLLLSGEDLEHATRIALNSVDVDLDLFFSTNNITN